MQAVGEQYSSREMTKRVITKIMQQSPYWSDRRKEMRIPEAALVSAVLGRAIEDLPGATRPECTQAYQHGEAAREFLFGKDSSTFFGMLGIDAEWAREKIRAWMRFFLKELQRKG